MYRNIVILILVILIHQGLSGQNKPQLITKDTTVTAAPAVSTEPKPERRWGDGGAGIGLDYGGLLGVKATFYPVKYMGVFAAAGWDLVGIGWNVGMLGRFVPADGKHGARPYLKVMYGVNGVTKVTGKTGYDELFYGLTVGAGLETRFGKKKKNGLNFDLNVPLRSPEFYDQLNRMKNDPQLTVTSEPWPVTISIGYMAEF